jgi:hypothetical protein
MAIYKFIPPRLGAAERKAAASTASRTSPTVAGAMLVFA